MKQLTELVLASGSPRRAEILAGLGLRFRVVISDIDERILDGESSEEHVRRLAREKAAAGLALDGARCATLGADTVVVLDGCILGKPRDPEHAARMLRSLSGRPHQVMSAVALAAPGGDLRDRLSVTTVYFEALPDLFIENYCRINEPMDKAGAYAIQGETGRFISRIEGSHTGVMGLAVHETSMLLAEGGVVDPISVGLLP